MTRRPVIGGDPGLDAGAVVVLGADGVTIVDVVAWQRRRRKAGDVWIVDSADERSTADNYGEVMRAVAAMADPSALCVVEEIRAHRGTSPQAAVVLAEAAGRLVQALGGAERVHATGWRPAVLGKLPRPYRDEHRRLKDAWGRYAIDCARGAFRGSTTLLANEHVAEAAWIARWGWARQARAA